MVNISYKGVPILSSTTTEIKSLSTSGKYCEADIKVENIESSTPSDFEFIRDFCPFTQDVSYGKLNFLAEDIAPDGQYIYLMLLKPNQTAQYVASPPRNCYRSFTWYSSNGILTTGSNRLVATPTPFNNQDSPFITAVYSPVEDGVNYMVIDGQQKTIAGYVAGTTTARFDYHRDLIYRLYRVKVNTCELPTTTLMSTMVKSSFDTFETDVIDDDTISDIYKINESEET